jgi:protein-S-isoprenylcysteine O-methyltransferase Ste14
MQALELRIRPPVVALILVALTWWLAQVAPTQDAPVPLRVACAAIIGLVGAAIGVAGKMGFRRAGTTNNPMRPEKASALVTGGVYRITRNPMDVSLLLLLVAWAVFLASGWALLGPLVFVLYIGRFQTKREGHSFAYLGGALWFGDVLAFVRTHCTRPAAALPRQPAASGRD